LATAADLATLPVTLRRALDVEKARRCLRSGKECAPGAGRLRRPLPQGVHVPDRDASPAGVDQPAFSEPVEGIAHRLAGRPYPPGELLLRQRDGDADAAGVGNSEVVGKFDQSTGDPADAVVGAELDTLAVSVSEPSAQHLEEGEGRSGMGGQEVAKLADGEDESLDRFESGGGG
jgi:hypothetical protein